MHQENTIAKAGQDEVSCEWAARGMLNSVAEGAEGVLCGLWKSRRILVAESG